MKIEDLDNAKALSYNTPASWHGEELDIYTKPGDLEKAKKTLEEKGIKIDSASLNYVAKEEVELSEKEKEQAQRLFDALDGNDAVNEIYSNLKS